MVGGITVFSRNEGIQSRGKHSLKIGGQLAFLCCDSSFSEAVSLNLGLTAFFLIIASVKDIVFKVFYNDSLNSVNENSQNFSNLLFINVKKRFDVRVKCYSYPLTVIGYFAPTGIERIDNGACVAVAAIAGCASGGKDRRRHNAKQHCENQKQSNNYFELFVHSFSHLSLSLYINYIFNIIHIITSILKFVNALIKKRANPCEFYTSSQRHARFFV